MSSASSSDAPKPTQVLWDGSNLHARGAGRPQLKSVASSLPLLSLVSICSSTSPLGRSPRLFHAQLLFLALAIHSPHMENGSVATGQVTSVGKCFPSPPSLSLGWDGHRRSSSGTRAWSARAASDPQNRVMVVADLSRSKTPSLSCPSRSIVHHCESYHGIDSSVCQPRLSTRRHFLTKGCTSSGGVVKHPPLPTLNGRHLGPVFP